MKRFSYKGFVVIMRNAVAFEVRRKGTREYVTTCGSVQTAREFIDEYEAEAL